MRHFSTSKFTCYCLFILGTLLYPIKNFQAQTILRVSSLSTATSPNGSSWENAFKDLQDALSASKLIMNSPISPDSIQIWIAKGIYYPTQADIRTRSFELQNKVSWYGGFEGTENSLEQRNVGLVDSLQVFLSDTLNDGTWNKETLVGLFSATILSGDIGIENDSTDNSYHVISGEEKNTLTLNGLVIMDGYTPTLEGGGIYNFRSSPTLSNCIFTRNVAKEGGGIYNFGASPTLTNCSFIRNTALNKGGGIYNSFSLPTLTGCNFIENHAEDGGGIYNLRSSPPLTDCNIGKNQSSNNGGGMYNVSSSPTLSNCIFSRNKSDKDGGGIYNHESSSPTLTDCSFNENQSSNNGGGMYNANSSNSQLERCSFSLNQSYSGGGMYNSNSSPTLAGCSFRENQSSDLGGGMYSRTSSNPTLIDCIFSTNQAGSDGGGMFNWVSFAILRDCQFIGNKTGDDGGGIYNNNASATLTSCNFNRNEASDKGGGMYDNSSLTTLTNCSFSENYATNDGGGLYHKEGELILTNSLINKNKANIDGGGIYLAHIMNKEFELINCTISENQGVEGNGGGIVCLTSVNLENCTIYQNGAKTAGGGLYVDSLGSINLFQSILAGNNADSLNQQDFHIVPGGSLSSLGYNLVGNADGFEGWQATDILGTVNAPLDPLLDTLAHNGGETQTHALLKDSPAINAGGFLFLLSPNLLVDQRGYSRNTNTNDTRSDIGAYERHSTQISFTENFTVCADSVFHLIEDIIIEDRAGGAFLVGDSQSLILSLPESFEFNTESTTIIFEGEGLIKKYSRFDTINREIHIGYDRRYTQNTNKIIISGLQTRFVETEGRQGIIRRIGGNAQQIDNQPEDSVIYGILTGFPSTKISPTHAYTESFEQNSGNWLALGEQNKWEVGIPNGSVIDIAADGINAWVTDLDKAYTISDTFTVESGCFDLSTLKRPMISLNIWSDTQEGFDGTVLQYTTDRGQNWITLGNLDSGIEWYNSGNISGNPGGQFLGWTGRDTTWRAAKHALPENLTEPVRFRLAFASIILVDTTQTNNGFAFDNVFIGEQGVNLLFEQHTNLNSENLGNDIIINNSNSLIPIKYFITKSQIFYDKNPLGPRTRALYYGISEAGISVLGGNAYMGSTAQLDQGFLDKSKLRGSVINIAIDSLNIAQPIQISSSKEFMNEELIVYMALVENEVAHEGKTYQHVFRKFLPDAAGISVWDWEINETKGFELKWPENIALPSSFIDDFENLQIVVFVQNQKTKEVYQAAAAPVWPELIKQLKENREGFSTHAGFSIYPNPVRGLLSLDFGQELKMDKQWELTDMQGRLIKNGALMKGQQSFQIQMGGVAEGHYMLRIGEDKRGWTYHRVVVMR